MFSDYLDEPIDLYLNDYCDEYEDYKENEKYYWKTQENKYKNYLKQLGYKVGD